MPSSPPAIGTRARLIVSEEIPGVTRFTIVLANSSPLSFTEVGAPLLPGERRQV